MESESESEGEDTFTALKEMTQNASEKTAHYFVFSGDNKAGMHGYEKVVTLMDNTLIAFI